MRICKVKCVDTGEQSTNDVAFKDPKTGKYYSSEENYNKIMEEKERIAKLRYDAYYLMCDILPGYDREIRNHLPSNFNTAHTKLGNQYGFDVFLNCIKSSADEIYAAVNGREFDSEWHKLQYVIAILKSNIVRTYNADVYEKNKKEKTEIIENIDITNHIDYKSRDISAFLEEDEDD